MKTKRVAVVTGSRRGIGRAIAEQLAQDGFFVVLSATAPEAGQLVAEFEAAGHEAAYIPCDIADAAAREHLVASVCERFGRIDVWVNNAGVAPEVRRDILETTEESYDRVLGINLRGTFFLCQRAANAMIAMKMRGDILNYAPRIINIGSMSADTSSTSRGEYCISKAGVGMVTALFADRLAEYEIPVFEVRPGIILTDMTSCVREKYEALIAGGLTPFRRMGRPEDVAQCVSAAAAGLLDFATGQVINADGGFHLRRL